VRLFVERARAVKPDFSVTNESAPAVAEICARLDGLPLAIELAAARIRLLSPHAMLTRLSNRLKFLKSGARNLPARQQTLRRTIDWSYELLEADEKFLFGRLSVFSGGYTLEAIEEICDPEGDADVLDGVESLFEKNLLRREEAIGEQSRFVMLETVHDYAREKLEESAEAESMKRAHAEYFLALAEEAEPELKGPDQVGWLGRLEAEHDNMRAALSWALQQGEAELALGLGGALWWFWRRRGYFSEGRRWLEGALAIDGRRLPGSRAMALAGLGMLAVEQGDIDRVQEACEEGLELLAHDGSEASWAKIYLLSASGYVALSREDYDRATQLYEESLALSREMRDDWALAFSLFGLALVSHRRGDPERTAELYEESIGIFREQGDKHGLAYGLNNLGLVARYQGDLVQAEKLTEESVALLRELGSGGDAEGLCNLGWMALLRNDLGKAADLYEETLTVAWDIERNPVVTSALKGFACLAGAHGEAERAARLWGAAQALHEGKGVPWDADFLAEFLAEADAHISHARSGMGEEAWEEASEEGRAMTLGEAVSYALEENAKGRT
jgi:tetratricopeptide (TPR) repeat protein